MLEMNLALIPHHRFPILGWA